VMTRTETIAHYQELFRKAGDQATLLMRELAKKDLFYLLVYILKRDDANNDWVFARCREVQANPNGFADIWSREHYKSTIITYALTIQEVINNPDITIGIFSFTRPIAKAFLRQIKLELEGNDTLKTLFPEIFWSNPKYEAPKWSDDDGIIVKRKGNPKEATIEAWGLVDSQPTSKHFKVLVFDDASERHSVSTPDMIKKTVDAWELAQFLGSDGGFQRNVGTFYHHNDLWNQKVNSGFLKPRIYPATEDGTIDGNPVLYGTKWLMDKKNSMTTYNFNAQILCNPSGESIQGFDMGWLRYWPAVQFRNLNIYLLCDPASSKKKDSDYTVFIVLGLGPDENYYVITMIRDRLSLTERANVLFSLHRQYKPIKTGYEKYGKDSDIEHFQSRMNEENYRFHITELGGKMAKEERINRLEPLFKNGRLYLPDTCIRTNYDGVAEDLSKVFVETEYRPFPFSVHDDMLDCLARVFDLNASHPEETLGPIYANVSKGNPDEAGYNPLDYRGDRYL